MEPPRVNTAPPHYTPVPPGHFSNPLENLIVAQACLVALPMEGDSPTAIETRRVRELLQTALAQQDEYSYSRDRIHSTPRPSRSLSYLSRLGSRRNPVPPNTFLDILHNPYVKLPTEEDLVVPDPEAQLVAALHVIPDWTVPYLAYMTRGELPEDETLAR